MLTVQACAKVNLTLEVLGKRQDGYHDVASVMQAIDLCETLSFEPHAEIHFRCSLPALDNEHNLVMKAARLLAQETNCSQGAFIYLMKRIPEAGGLGGGSSDAAAALKGLNQLWDLGLPETKLVDMAASLGSDVPFFIHGGTALAEGRGEKLTPLPSPPQSWFVLLMPELATGDSKTASLYARITPAMYTHGESARDCRSHLSQDKPAKAEWLYNVFEKVAFDFFPGLTEYRRRFMEAGAASVHLAGSGPTLYTIAPDQHSAHDMWHRLGAMGLRAEIACTHG